MIKIHGTHNIYSTILAAAQAYFTYLFAGVVVNEALRELKAAVDNYFSQAEYKIEIDIRPFHPHITIATRDLHKKDFHDAWPMFENKAE